MWSPGCICCSPFTVQQEGARKVLESISPRSEPVQFCKCLSCNSLVCSFCIHALLELTASKRCIPQDDVSLVALKNMQSAITTATFHVDLGYCCAFKASIIPQACRTITKPPSAPCISESTPAHGYKQCNKKPRRELKRSSMIIPSTSNFLEDYFNNTSDLLKQTTPADISSILKKINKSRKPTKKYKQNITQGALIFPEYELVIQADATNYHLNCDHMALAESPLDNTKAVIHGVISSKNSKQVIQLLEDSPRTVDRISGSKERIVMTVEAPEDSSKNKIVTIDVITIDQVKSHHDVAHMKGMTEYDPSYICRMKFFGHQDIK